MAEKRTQSVEDILRDMFIAQLGVAGLTQRQIQGLVGVHITRVNRIVRHMKKLKERSNERAAA
jgi:plasmid maintenance system antidote protein VapI